ncbi:MAG: GNAT family N-acetyltransferase [Scytolyngbya sp. HA4215-MV1]|jgi:GNAT superfamily N-acetyltransferase|nr:GNAT family N-acetyltransferase [Scytolyngbya sp. HA4215-MV1]
MFTIHTVQKLFLASLTEMLTESQSTGFRAVQRLLDEWETGTHRFDRPGEARFVATINRQTIGICGLTIDPYTDQLDCGRVRRLYVMMEHRCNGIGHALVERVIAEARLSFTQLHVRTDHPITDRLYRSISIAGLSPLFRSAASHPSIITAIARLITPSIYALLYRCLCLCV